jgi:hypothetical protein
MLFLETNGSYFEVFFVPPLRSYLTRRKWLVNSESYSGHDVVNGESYSEHVCRFNFCFIIEHKVSHFSNPLHLLLLKRNLEFVYVTFIIRLSLSCKMFPFVWAIS